MYRNKNNTHKHKANKATITKTNHNKIPMQHTK